MLYWIAAHLGFPGLLNLIRYQTFRTGGAVATALVIGLLIGPRFIGWLRLRQGKGQPIRLDGPQSHLAKRGTPTMGGLMILTAMALAILLWMDLGNPYVWACLFVTLGFGAIGFMDDYDKVRKATTAGIPGRIRLLLEFVIAGVAGLIVMHQTGTHLSLPFSMGWYLELGWAYPLFAAFTIVAFGNAVNLTDGLDGLATMPVIIASVTFMLIVYLAGNVKFATYLGIPHVPGAGELAIFCGAVVGAGLAFLWFNAPPAAVFMGDTGSLALGGALGTIAVVAPPRDRAGRGRRPVRGRGAERHHPGVLLQAHRQARVPYGADPPPFRAARLERADRGDPLLDRFLRAGACRPRDAEIAVIVSPTWAGKRFAVLGLARSGAATVAALLAGGADVTAWDSDSVRREGHGAATIADVAGQDLAGFDALVVSPGVPLNTHPLAAAARAAAVPIIGDIECCSRRRAPTCRRTRSSASPAPTASRPSPR